LKAKDYVSQLAEGAEQGEVVAAFAKETAELVEKRTAKSAELYVHNARDGALREQRQKWLSVATQAKLSVSFDDILSAYLTDIKVQHEKWLHKRDEVLTSEQKKVSVDKAKLKGFAGRAVADRLAAMEVSLGH
jgi:hypothetical protein